MKGGDIVYDLETGEPLGLRCENSSKDHENDSATERRKKASYEKVNMFTPYSLSKNEATQSFRKMGEPTGLTMKFLLKKNILEEKKRESLPGLEIRLKEMMAKPDKNEASIQQLQFRIVSAMREKFAKRKKSLVDVEIQREIKRQVEMKLELSAAARRRMKKSHDQQREHYKNRIERIAEEGDLTLAAKMAEFKLLR